MEQKLLHAGLAAAMNGVQRNCQIFPNEFGRIRVVGMA
jgi:hypothetical protein